MRIVNKEAEEEIITYQQYIDFILHIGVLFIIYSISINRCSV
jgi:hypothetical protein